MISESRHLDRNLLHPRFWPAWLGMGFFRLAGTVPQSWMKPLGRALGRLAYRFARQRVQIARRNIELCFPGLDEDAREQLVKEHLASVGMSIFEIPFAWWGRDERFAGLAEVSGLENLHAAAGAGKGVLLLSAHFTSLEIGGRFLALRYPFDAMHRPSGNPVVQHVMLGARKRHCKNIIPRDAVKRLIRSLRNGRAVWYAPDQNTQRKQAVFVKFFGHLASTTPATARLASVTGARVVPFLSVRQADGRGYNVVFEPALEDFPTGDLEADTQRINDIIERWVREYPDQYLWIHRRFRTRPDSTDPKIY